MTASLVGYQQVALLSRKSTIVVKENISGLKGLLGLLVALLSGCLLFALDSIPMGAIVNLIVGAR